MCTLASLVMVFVGVGPHSAPLMRLVQIFSQYKQVDIRVHMYIYTAHAGHMLATC